MTDRTLLYGVVVDETVYLIVANADSEGACVPSETGLTVQALDAFAGTFRVLAASSVFKSAVVSR